MGMWLLIISGATYADGMSIVLNGLSHHINPPDNLDLNEENWGIGFQYDFVPVKEHWIPFVNASGFKDSLNNPSYYAGGGFMRRFSMGSNNNLHLDAGLVAFIMTREDYKDNDPFPGILSMISVGNEKIAVNITYIPKVHQKIVPVWFLQLKVPLSNFM
jgi:hypothetical protein